MPPDADIARWKALSGLAAHTTGLIRRTVKCGAANRQVIDFQRRLAYAHRQTLPSYRKPHPVIQLKVIADHGDLLHRFNACIQLTSRSSPAS